MKIEKPGWIKKIRAIGWDLDGTLYPQGAIPWSVVHDLQIQKVMVKHDWTQEKAEAQFAKIRQELGSTTQTLNVLGVDGEAFFTNLWNELPLEDYLKPDPKLAEMFNRLKKYRHFIVSNSNLVPMIEKKLGLLGLDPKIFEVIISTNEVGATKPDPAPFMAAMERMQREIPVLRVDQVLYVGDRIDTDIVGAKAMEMRTCLVGTRSYEADIWVDSVYQVADLLEG